MRVWRICRSEFAADPLGGRGGLFTSGRWHTRGRRIVYTSSSRALAVLELLVHAGRDNLPGDLVLIEIEIPGALPIQRVEVGELPSGWREYPAPEQLQRLGDAWLADQPTPILEVPSAIVPEEANYLINPDHPQATRVRMLGVRDFAFDARLS